MMKLNHVILFAMLFVSSCTTNYPYVKVYDENGKLIHSDIKPDQCETINGCDYFKVKLYDKRFIWSHRGDCRKCTKRRMEIEINNRKCCETTERK